MNAYEFKFLFILLYTLMSQLTTQIFCTFLY